MLGDITPSRTASNTPAAPARTAATLTSPPPSPQAAAPKFTGYGASSFGPRVTTTQTPQAPAAPQPVAHYVQPHVVAAPGVTAAPAVPAHAPSVPVQSTAPSFNRLDRPAISQPAVLQSSKSSSKSSKAPLYITLAGVIIFVGGVAGLFIYALSA